MCMLDYGDSSPSVYRAEMRRSQKERRCAECSRIISKGETYQNVFAVYDGDSSTYTTCEHCLVGVQWLRDNCGGFLHRGVWEDLEEHIVEYPTLADSLLALADGRKRFWKRLDGDGLMPIPTLPPTLEAVGLERQH